MKARQTLPRQWLIVAEPPSDETWRSLRRLPRGRGILLLAGLSTVERRRLRHIAASRGLVRVDEAIGEAARVHSVRELRRALLRRTPLILLSPIFPTASHPGWKPLPRMGAATLARLAGRRAVALGGMNQERYAKIAQLGFMGWAGISAFRT